MKSSSKAPIAVHESSEDRAEAFLRYCADQRIRAWRDRERDVTIAGRTSVAIATTDQRACQAAYYRWERIPAEQGGGFQRMALR